MYYIERFFFVLLHTVNTFSMSNFSQATIDKVWQTTRALSNLSRCDNHDINMNPDEFRLDDFGAIIKKSEYGKQSKYGWTIDHSYPISKGGTDALGHL